MPPDIPTLRFTELLSAAASVAGQTDLTQVLVTTIETAMELTGAPYGALGVIGEHGTLSEFIHAGMDNETVESIGTFPLGKGLLGTITRNAETVRIDRIADHPDSVGFPAHHPPMESFLGVPLRTGDSIYGNLYLTDKDGGFTDEDEAIVQGLAVVAGSAVATARMQRRLRRLAVVGDRERIARDLHDAIIQDLFAVGLSLQAQSLRVEGELRVDLEDAVQRLDGAIAELRRFIFDLRPPAWAHRDIGEELRAMAARLSESHEANVIVRLGPHIVQIPPASVDDVLQIVSESVSNALRHSQSDRVTIDVDVLETDVVIGVADEGVGFDVTATTDGMGLDNLRSRADRAGGEARITSTPGKGTQVRVVLPI